MKLKNTLTNNSPTILAGLGIVGFITAIAMTARAAPKAEKALEDLPVDPPLKEKLRVIGPIYAPTVGMILMSTACIVGSSRIHRYRYASLLALYSIGQQSLDHWQSAVLDTVGKKKYEKIRERVAEPESDPPVSIVVDDERTLFYDVFTGRYFRSDSIDSVRKVINSLNDTMFQDDFASLNDFYFGVGLDPVQFGDDWGWSLAHGSFQADFDAFLRNDRPVVSITFQVEPKKY